MTFSPTKPDAGKSPAIDVSQIQTNFSLWASVFDNNHTAITGLTRNSGDHESVIIPKRVGDVGVTQDLSVLFCKDATSNAGTQPQLFSQILKFLPTTEDHTNAQNVGVQLTYQTVNIAGPQYQTFLPGGYLVIFGTETISGTNYSTTITLTTIPTKILVAFASSNGLGFYNCSTKIISNSQFSINTSLTGGAVLAPATPFTWLIVGTV